MEEKETKEKEAKEKETTKESFQKKRLQNLSEGEREKKGHRVLKLNRQAKKLKDVLAGGTPGEA